MGHDHCRSVIQLLIILAVGEILWASCQQDYPHYNAIDKCWRKSPGWESERMRLADCARGFGSYAQGGKGGRIYTITSASDNPNDPQPGTLRHAVTRGGPLWIVFAHDMGIQLQMPLFVAPHKTIDGRGAAVHIGDGPCIRVWNTSNVIIHGLRIHNCKESSPGVVMISKRKGVERIYPQDGDGISIASAKDVWIDHNTLSSCGDGLIDITDGSTEITISNNRFYNHNEAMLLGNSDTDSADRRMRVTIAFNHFGPNLIQRMPRVREGFVHVANNHYEPWGIYAIGGSAHPTILSEGNFFLAPVDYTKKQVTEHKGCGEDCVFRTVRDRFMNAAYFEQVNANLALPTPMYNTKEVFKLARARNVPLVTRNAGVLDCYSNRTCF